jgi:uncharacterized protein YegL
MTLFFIIDTSGSMAGKKIGAVNTAIEEVIPEIKKISADSADAEIRIAAMTFSTGAEWLTPQPAYAEHFEWKYRAADGVTDFGKACAFLNEKLSRKGYMNAASGSYAPVILLLSDGEPTDDYVTNLADLKKNSWFKHGLKYAIAIGDDANEEVLAEFAGHKEAVLKVHTPEALARLIRFVAVTSSQIGSKSQDAAAMADNTTKQDVLNGQIQDFADNDLQDDEEDDWG